MKHRSDAGDGDGATYALSKTDQRASRPISRGGRAGATARQIGFRRMEAAGLASGLRLLRRGLVKVTPDNRFVLVQYADDERDCNGRIKCVCRIPLPQPTAKPAPVDVTGMTITKLPPGEARGARDLRRWHGSK